jgi:L-fuconolactonase
MKIDAHQHFWQYNQEKYPWITPQMRAIRHDFMPKDLINVLKINDIDATIAVEAFHSEEETNFLINLANEHAFIKGIVGWVDLKQNNIDDRLAYYSSFPKLKGFRHSIESESDANFMMKPDFMNGISKLEKHNFTFDLLISSKQLNLANLFVKQFPNQKFVINHLAKPNISLSEITLWAKEIHEIAQNENVFCKISGLVTENDWNLWVATDFKPYLDVVFDAFGTNRLMFASDWPVCMLAASYGQVLEIVANYIAQLTDNEQDKIWSRNAIDFYSLKN